MAILTIEGTIENGQIRLREPMTLPESTRVYVVVPGVESVPQVRVWSPRFARPEQASQFEKQVIEVTDDA